MTDTRMLRFTINALSNYSRMVLTIVATVAITPRLITTLGTEAFGVWALVNAAAGMLILLDLGMANAVVRAAAGTDVQARNRLVSTLWVVSLLVVTLALLAVGVSLPHIPRLVGLDPGHADGAAWVFVLVAARQVVVGQGLGIFRQVLFGSNRLVEINLIQGGTLVAQTVAIWIGLGHGISLTGVAAIGLAAGILEHFGYVVAAYRLVPGLRLSPRLASLDEWREARSLCVASFLMGISGLVLLKTDPLLVRAFLPITAVAVYAIALKIAENLLLLIKQIANALTPMIVQLAVAGDTSRLRRLLLTSTKYLIWPTAMAAAAAAAFGGDAIRLWVGNDFAAAGPILTVLLTAMTITSACLPAGSILTQAGMHRVAGRASLAGAAINILASAVLAQSFGILGIAGGTLVAAVLVDAGIVIRLTNRHLAISLRDYVRDVIVPVAPSAAVLWMTSTALAWLVGRPETFIALAANAAASGTAAVVAFALTGVTADERRRVQSHVVAPLLHRFSGRIGQPVVS